MSGGARRITVQLPEGRITLRGRSRGSLPTLANNPGLQQLYAKNREVYEALAPVLPHLLAHEEQLFDWLRADPDNLKAFVAAPVATFQRACQPSAELTAALKTARAAVRR